MKPEVTKYSMLSMQVCVPEDYTDEQVVAFAEQENPCGTTAGWCVRKEGHDLLAGDPERVRCDEREGCVHVMLDA